MLAVLKAARKLLEAIVKTRARDYKSDFARRYYGQGKAEGKAGAILEVLSARGIDVPEQARVRISECTDLERLESWVRRAVTARSVEDLFAP